MSLSQQTKPYPRTMYHVNHEKPKVVNSRAEEAEASTKGWIVSYIYKEYPKWVDGKIVQSRAEEERLLAERKPLLEVALDAIEQGPASGEEVSADLTETLFSDTGTVEVLPVVKEVQVDGQDTAVVEKPKEGNGRRKKK